MRLSMLCPANPLPGRYRNSLYFCCNKKIRTKKTYENILSEYNFTTRNFPRWLPTTHKHFPNCCCPCILVYVVASNTTSHFLFTSHLFSTWSNLLNINAHHTRLVKLISFNSVCAKIILRK